MWGLFYTGFISVGLLIDKCKKIKRNKHCKFKYKNVDNLTYTDIQGKTRLLSDDKLVFYITNSNGEYILEDINGNLIKNFSKENEDKSLNELKEISIFAQNSTYCIDKNTHKYDRIKKGKRFKDFETGEIYIVRCINYKYYFMNINTGLLVRETDWQKQYNLQTDDLKKYKKGVDIESFNNNQKNIDDEELLFREFDYNCSCDFRY